MLRLVKFIRFCRDRVPTLIVVTLGLTEIPSLILKFVFITS